MGRGKSEREIKNLKVAARITKHIFSSIKKRVKPGVTEKDVAAAINGMIKKRGLRPAFTTIVASGPNAALPHAKVTPRRIRERDMVVIDFGVTYKGYRSDMTRTLIFGKISSKLKRLYKTVRVAQKMAIRKISAGTPISDVAGCAHAYMRKKGFGKYILHSLGHGVGKRIHEAPKLSERNRGVFKKGMVVTVEPGLYMKGIAGARVEDMVLATAKGREVLTR